MASGIETGETSILHSREDEELDMLRRVLVYILLEDASVDMDEIYSLVFRDGGSITWH